MKVIEHLVGMQSQAPLSAYFGLWSRIEGFWPDALAKLILQRKVVRIALMRSTVHLVTAKDCLRLRSLVQPVLERSFHGNWGKQLRGAEPAEVARAGRAVVEAEPRTGKELGTALGARWPDSNAQALANAVRTYVPLVQVPPRGVWGQSGQTTVTSAEAWLGRPPETSLTLDALFLRYLAAFGPATPKDAQVWSGLTGFAEAAERLRPKLLTFCDPSGRELFDLPDAPRPPEDTPAPARLVAEFDNLLLSHEDRIRVISAELRKRLFTVNGLFPGTVLVEGFVAGEWKLDADKERAAVRITAWRTLHRKERAAVGEEAERLLRFAAPDATKRDLTFA